MPINCDDEAVAPLAEAFGALAHPVRIRALKCFANQEGKLSASRLQGLMPDVALGTLAYHVRQLAGAGLLRPAGHVQRRGAVEHLYLVTPKGAALLAGMEGLLQLVQKQV